MKHELSLSPPPTHHFFFTDSFYFFYFAFLQPTTHDTKILNAYMTKLKHYITVVYDNKKWIKNFIQPRQSHYQGWVSSNEKLVLCKC